MGVAVIGAGTISDQYLADMVAYPDLDVRFVADVVTDRAAAQAAKFGVPGSGSVAEALSRDDVELIVNLTIPAAHADIAGQALTAGKHVWNEKPLATNRADAQAMVNRSDELGLRLGCAPDTVLGPGLQTARRWLERGDIGRPLSASVVMQNSGPHHWHPNPDFLFQAGAGPLLDMGPYYLSALVQMMGAIRRVVALGSTSGPTRTIGMGPRAGQSFDVTVASHVGALYEFHDGGVAQATFSFDSHLERAGVVEISGTEGSLIAPDPNTFGGLVEVVRAEQGERDTVRTSVDVAEQACGRGIGVLDMARSIHIGEPHRANGRVALHVLDVLLATEESIGTGGFVDVRSEAVTPPPLPADWDPLASTLPGP